MTKALKKDIQKAVARQILGVRMVNIASGKGYLALLLCRFLLCSLKKKRKKKTNLLVFGAEIARTL